MLGTSASYNCRSATAHRMPCGCQLAKALTAHLGDRLINCCLRFPLRFFLLRGPSRCPPHANPKARIG